MKATLFGNHKVEIVPQTLKVAPGWPKRSKVLEFFFGQMKKIDNPVVLDIGACVGIFTLLAKFHPCQMYAFEPNPKARSILERNVALNKLRNVRIFDFALFHKDGQAKLRIPRERDRTGLTTLGSHPRFMGGMEIRVKTKRLDACGLDQVDLIKVDTEGAELYVLQGAEVLLRKCHPPILMESHEKAAAQFSYHPDEVTDFLKTLGYTHFRRVTRDDAWVSEH